MVSLSQLAKVEFALRDIAATGTKSWLRNADVDAAIEYIRASVDGVDLTPSRCAVVGGVFIMFSVGRQWWASRPVLAEELMLRIEPGADIVPALAFLERTAQLLACTGVVLGTSISTNDAALTRLYRRFGYVESANVLYKEV